MSWLDKLLGRGKQAAGDMTGDSSMKRDGMHQEQEGMASERAESAEEMAQEERERAAEHDAERTTRNSFPNRLCEGGSGRPLSVPSDAPL